MRIPSDLTADPSPRRRHRARWWLIGLVVVLVVLLVSLRSLASIYTDSLWFSSVHLHNVFSTLLAIKLGLFGVFGAIFFVMLWVNLVVCDRLAGHDIVLAQEDELVRRYQQFVRPYAGRIYVALAFVLALIGASGTIGQWNNWILFPHGGSFGATDPQFHKDVGFYVFKLPFLTFLVDWTLAILIVTLAVTVVFHYLNGGIRPQRGLPRVRPPVKAHLSVLLALIALDKAAGLRAPALVARHRPGRLRQRRRLHRRARPPARRDCCSSSCRSSPRRILLYNIRRQGWTLPVLAVGIWAFVALVVGVIYPALLQTLKVTPAQSTLEAPYIQRNINATRDGLRLDRREGAPVRRPARASRPARPSAASPPSPTSGCGTRTRPSRCRRSSAQQAIKSYYSSLARGRPLHGRRAAARRPSIGVRQIIVADLPSPSWVNTHLQYTHGNGAALALANQTNSEQPRSSPSRTSRRTSSHGTARTSPSPAVYFGLDETGYVVANTKQPEVDYQRPNGTSVESHYSGTGGVQLSSSSRGPPSPSAWATSTCYLQPDHEQVPDHVRPRPGGHGAEGGPVPQLRLRPLRGDQRTGSIDWVLDGYTTTANYPYSQNADTQQVAVGQRPARQLQLRAQLGQGRHRRLLGEDDLLRRRPERPDPRRPTSRPSPDMFTPLSKMSPHLRPTCATPRTSSRSRPPSTAATT